LTFSDKINNFVNLCNFSSALWCS